MSRLIDADKINTKDVIGGTSKFANDIRQAMQDLIDNAPTVDAEPVRHGNWIEVSERLPNANEEYLEYFPVIVKGIIDGGTHDGEEIICKGFGKYIDWEREWEVETSIDTKIYPREVLAWFRTPEYEPKEDKYE